MKLLNRFYRILVALIFTSSTAFASRVSELKDLVLTGDLYGRSSIDFRKNSKNIKFTIPEGSEGTVLETRKLSRTGSYGVKIRLTKVNGTRGKITPKVGDETWVYFSQKDPWLTFKDKWGAEVDDPELALISRAQKDGEGLHLEGVAEKVTLPTKEEVLREQKRSKEDPRKNTEAGVCDGCSVGNWSLPAKNLSTVKDLEKDLAKTKAPEVIPDKKWSQFPEVVKYSTSEAVENSISYGMRNKEKHSKKLCYRYVKRALLGGDLVEDYLPGVKARYGVSDLKRRGFKNMLEDPRYKNLIQSPEDAPKGAIMIYRHTKDRKHAGHIEIKTDWGTDGGYVSDFYRSKDKKLFNRELIGVMIKEKP